MPVLQRRLYLRVYCIVILHLRFSIFFSNLNWEDIWIFFFSNQTWEGIEHKIFRKKFLSHVITANRLFPQPVSVNRLMRWLPTISSRVRNFDSTCCPYAHLPLFLVEVTRILPEQFVLFIFISTSRDVQLSESLPDATRTLNYHPSMCRRMQFRPLICLVLHNIYSNFSV